MAEINFTETDAAKIHNALIGSLEESVKEPMYPGDERRIFGDGVAALFVSLYNTFNDRMKQKLLRYARGTVLDELGARIGVERAAPAHAAAVFRFSVSAARSENIIIPEGTKITSDGSVYFATDNIAVLQAGSLYVDVVGTCTEGGAKYNGFAVATIATLVDLIPYIASVGNITISTGGDDGEPYTEEGDNRFRERIRLAPTALSTAGTESGYRYFAMSADPDIIDVAVDSPSANVINIYPLMRGGELPDSDTLEKVEAACSAADRRPMSDYVTAVSPEAVEYDISIKYYCTQSNEAATVKAVEADGGAIDRYNEWQTSALDRDINPDYLRKLVLSPDWDSALVGADRIEITSPTFTTIGKAQVAKFSGILTVTHEVIT